MSKLQLELKNKTLIPYFKYRTTNIFSASSLILLAVCVFISSCTSNKPEEIQAISDREERPTLIMRDLETVITDSGKVRIRMITPEMLQYKPIKKEDHYTDFPKGINVIMYLPDGKVEGQIKADKAVLYEAKDLWELNNDVEAVSKKNEILNTEQLFWDMKKEIIYTDKFVKVTSKDGIWMGTGLEADQNMDNWVITNLTGEVDLQEDGSN